MAKPSLRILSLLATCLCAVLILRCQDGGSELPNELRGAVVSRDGRPAADVKVGLYSINYAPSDTGAASQAWTTHTDAAGKYAFANIPTGRYNIVGTRDSLGFFRDSVSVSGGADAGQDALGSLGTLTGTVRLQPQDEPRNAVVQVMGTENYVNVDSGGMFTLTRLAGGFYRLRVSVSLPDYVPLFKEVQVRGGGHDTLPDPLVPFFSGIPVVVGVHTSFDTARGIARIAWSPVSYPSLLTYLVYRDPANAINLSLAPINSNRVEDTVFYDTLYHFDPASKAWDDSLPHAWEYRIRVEGKNTKIGEPYKPAVLQAVPPLIQATRISIKRIGGDPTRIFKGDTVRWVGKFSNASFLNRKLVWLHAVDTLRARDLSTQSGSDTLVWIAPKTLMADSLRMVVTDATGKPWVEIARFETVSSRIIGTIKSPDSRPKAYAWNGKIVHVSQDTLQRVLIGLFNISTKRDSLLSTDATLSPGIPLVPAISGSKLIVLGAHHPDFPSANALAFDLATGAWSALPAFTDRLVDGGAAAVGGKLYVISADTLPASSVRVSVLDLSAPVWTSLGSHTLPIVSYDFNLSEANGRLYLISSMNGPYLSAIQEFDAARNSWKAMTPAPNMGNALGFRIAGLGGEVYLVGGTHFDDPFFRNEVYAYDRTSDSWQSRPPLLAAHGQPGTVAIGSSLFLVSGQIDDLSVSPNVEEYVPE